MMMLQREGHTELRLQHQSLNLYSKEVFSFFEQDCTKTFSVCFHFVLPFPGERFLLSTQIMVHFFFQEGKRNPAHSYSLLSSIALRRPPSDPTEVKGLTSCCLDRLDGWPFKRLINRCHCESIRVPKVFQQKTLGPDNIHAGPSGGRSFPHFSLRPPPLPHQPAFSYSLNNLGSKPTISSHLF